MDNDNIAHIFQKVARLLEIKGDSRFKVSAYDHAAESIRIYPEPLEKMSEEDLKTIPGVGQAIADKIVELNSTGSLRFLERLEKEIPTELLKWLELPGVGPKTTALIWQTLHITGLDELRQAAVDKKLQAIEGIGEKLENRILAAIPPNEG